MDDKDKKSGFFLRMIVCTIWPSDGQNAGDAATQLLCITAVYSDLDP